MIRVETLDGEELSKICKNVSPCKYESIQLKNKLLDGTYHLQTIGKPLKYKDFILIATESQVEKMNLLETKGESIKLLDNDRFYIGNLSSSINWTRLTIGYRDREKRLYEGKATIIIKEEGNVV